MNSAFDGFLANRRESILQLVLVAGCLILVTLLTTHFVVRFDWTAENRYTLSPASKQIVADLDDPITVTAYFTDNLPGRLQQVKQRFRSLLTEFRAASGGSIEYTFVNPNATSDAERAARQAGIRPVTVDVRQQDQVSQKRAYLGATFQYGDATKTLGFVEPGSSPEYLIARTVKELTLTSKPRIGVLQGHGEPSLQAMTQLRDALSARYTVTPVSGIDTTGVPPDVEVLLVVRPTQSLSTPTTRAIDQYLMRGGRAIFAPNRVDVSLRMGAVSPQTTGLNTLLSAYGVPVDQNLLRDAQASTVRMRQRRGGFQVVNRVRFPYFPQITRFADHPITSGLETVALRFASSVDTAQVDSAASATVLASTSNLTGSTQPPTRITPQQEWARSDFPGSSRPVAALLEGTIPSAFAGVDTLDVARTRSEDTRLVVFGDGDFIVNGSGGGRRGRQSRQRQLPQDNVNLMVNAIDYLANDTGLIALRTKGVTNRPLMQVSPGTKALLKYGNVLLPILLVLGYGLVRYRRNRARRERWKLDRDPSMETA